MAKRNPNQTKSQWDDERMLSIRISSAMVDRFRLAAEADHRTVSQELRRLIDERIAEHERGEQDVAA